MNKALVDELESVLGEELADYRGGSGLVATDSGRRFFLKTGAPSAGFRCEANGLKELAAPGVIAVVEVISAGEDYILTEYIDDGTPGGTFFEEFGRQLARVHRCTAESFGFYEDNYVGANPQPNVPTEAEARDWAEFYWNKRLLYQYRLAELNGYVSPALAHSFAWLESKIGGLLGGSEVPPCLLHGDLWSGNFLCDRQGRAVLIDPAVYYGHREADLAMTKMFGGFSPAFYRGYQQEYPLAAGWERRENLYLLYHVMNHLNLFGGGYLRQAERLAATY